MRFSPTKSIHNLLLLTSLLLAACGGGGGGTGGNNTVNPPAAPTVGIPVAGCNATVMYINWSLATGATGYNIYRSATLGGALTKLNVTAPLVSATYTDTGLIVNTPYFYKVTALNSGGESLKSNEATSSTLPAPSCTQMGGSFQGNALTLSGGVTTLAGKVGLPDSTNGTGTSAQFRFPEGITTDGTNLYVADTANHTIRKITGGGVVSTLTGTALTPGSTDTADGPPLFNNPKDVTTDGIDLYVADTNNHTIRKITAGGTVTTVAGTALTPGSTDTAGGPPLFNFPHGITTDGVYLYVADTNNHTIRKIVIASGIVTTLSGTALSSGATDTAGGAPLFNSPQGITTDGTNLYVADTSNHTIRKIVIASGTVTTLTGTALSPGATDTAGGAPLFNFPQKITTDLTNLYVADTFNHTIRKVVIASGVVTTLAGTALSSGTTNGTGAAARFNTPSGITTDGTYLYTTDTTNHTIRRIQ